MKISNKLKIGNYIFLVYLIYIFWVICVEWINFIYSILGRGNLKFGLAEFWAIVLVIVVCYKLKKVILIEKVSYRIDLVIGIVIILILGVVFSAYPDKTYDTSNYHLIAQNPKFRNYFIEDFGYGNFQVWGFRLADRMFYYFRNFLGYRFGTYFNTLSFVVSYVQIFTLLNEAEKKEKGLLYKILFNKSVWSLIIFFSLDAIMMYGTYCVDAIAIPVGLEVIRLLIDDYNRKVSVKNNVYFALLCGVWIGIKMTNVVYVIPCVVIYLILHVRQFKIIDWIGTILAGVLPFSEYLIYNWKCTGNPIFPYYNAFFKSPYFPARNFKDGRFGGINLWEKLFWIWSAAFRPECRLSEIWDKRNGILIISLIASLIVVTYMFIKHYRDKEKLQWKLIMVVMIAAVSSSLWGITTGISRYYIFGRVLWGLIAFWCVFVFFEKWNVVGKIIAFMCLCVCAISTILNVREVLAGRNWSWNKWAFDTFPNQIKLVFHDNDIETDYNQDVDCFVLTSSGVCGVAELIDDDVYAINTSYLSKVAIMDGQKMIEDRINESNHVYDLHKRAFGNICEYAEQLNNNLIYAVDMVPIDLSIGIYEMVSIENLDGRKNTVWTSKDGEWTCDVSEISGGKILSFIGGRIYDWPGEEIKFVISLSDGSDDRIVSTVQINNSSIKKYDVMLDISEEDTTLKVMQYYVGSGEIVDVDQTNYAFGMNMTVIED